jgi:pyruvate/2-oxoglutarate dehydrogenase complex dihydrolipoamide acyltransferase (E2) component
MTAGVLVTWLKAEGDYVAKGESLAQIETDKAVVEFESPVAGTVARLQVQAGAKVSVEAIIADLETGS